MSETLVSDIVRDPGLEQIQYVRTLGVDFAFWGRFWYSPRVSITSGKDNPPFRRTWLDY